MPDVSIIMPCFNAEKYIIESVGSVLKQSFTAFELIIVDDASSDQTVDILNERCLTDPRIKLICSKKNQGVSESRNVGLANAIGKYIAFLDSDDSWDSTKLEKQLATLKSKNVEFTWCNAVIVDDFGRKITYERARGVFEKKYLLSDCFFRTSSVCYVRNSNTDFVFNTALAHAEDLDIWIRMASVGVTGIRTEGCTINYRISPGSLSSAVLSQMKSRYRVIALHEKNILLVISAFLKYLYRAILKRLAIFRYGLDLEHLDFN